MQRSWCVIAFAAVVAVSVLVSATQAADPPKKAPDPAKVFAKKDTNGDGSLSLDEFKAGLKQKALETADKRFKRSDSNADGKLSLDEFKAGMQPKKN
jgi:Ca2+-binding EF-hand superfamily protein